MYILNLNDIKMETRQQIISWLLFSIAEQFFYYINFKLYSCHKDYCIMLQKYLITVH